MPYSSRQKGVVHLLIPVILVVGLILGVYIVSQRTNIFPKASSDPVDDYQTPYETPYDTPDVSTPTPSTEPISYRFGSCADSAGNKGKIIKCSLSSYNSAKNNICTGDKLYPYYFESCVSSPPVSPEPKVNSCPSGTEKKECIGYGANGINQYCWGENNAYLGGICSANCAGYKQCK